MTAKPIDDRLLADVQQAEGCRLVAYLDSLGNWTIGYGHKLDSGINWEGHEITLGCAVELLSQDLDHARAQAELLPEWGCLDGPCRQNAVVELCFNMGAARWMGFHQCRQAITEGDWQDAHDQLLASRWAFQVGPHRSQRLAAYLLTGVYPNGTS